MDARCNASWLRVCAAAVAISGIVGFVTPTVAQQPGGAAAAGESISRWTSRQRSFEIPFQLAEDDKSSIVELYYSHNGKGWQLYERSKAGGGKFVFRAEDDGAYWFTSRTIDPQGKPHPTGPLQAELLVIVDATAPQVDLQLTSDATGNIQCSWEIEDPGLAPTSLTLEYEAGGSWKPVTVQLPPQQTQAGVTKLKGGATWRPEVALTATRVRLSISDAAGNQAQPIETVKIKPALAGQGTPSAPPTQPAQPAPREEVASERLPTPRETTSPAHDPRASAWRGGSVVASPAAASNRSREEAAAPEEVATPSPSVPRPSATEVVGSPRGGSHQLPIPVATPAQPKETRNPHATSAPAQTPAPTRSSVASTPGAKPWYAEFQAQQARSSTDESPTNRSASPVAAAPVAGPVAPPVTRRAAENTSSMALEWADLVVESTNAGAFQLDYDLESVGPEGVAKVVLWVTRDKGQQWAPMSEDADRVTPIDVNVTEEGLYGFRVQVTGNNGLGAEPPKSGEQADIWIHVDNTPPIAELQNVPYGRGPTAGKLEIYWTADDVRLASRPVTLRYAESPNGPWTTIAASIPNEGKYVWPIEPNTPKEVFLRLEVTDRAGNIGVDQLADPVRLQPLIPKARIRGFKPVSRVPLGTNNQTALLR